MLPVLQIRTMERERLDTLRAMAAAYQVRNNIFLTKMLLFADNFWHGSLRAHFLLSYLNKMPPLLQSALSLNAF